MVAETHNGRVAITNYRIQTVFFHGEYKAPVLDVQPERPEQEHYPCDLSNLCTLALNSEQNRIESLSMKYESTGLFHPSSLKLYGAIAYLVNVFLFFRFLGNTVVMCFFR